MNGAGSGQRICRSRVDFYEAGIQTGAMKKHKSTNRMLLPCLFCGGKTALRRYENGRDETGKGGLLGVKIRWDNS